MHFADFGLSTVAANLCQFGVLLNLYAPALVSGEVPVKVIEFVGSHYVKVFLDEIHIEEMTYHIEVHTAVCKTWMIFSNSAWYGGIAGAMAFMNELHQC